MPYKGFTSVTLKTDLVRKLEKRLSEEYRDRPVKPSLASYVSELLWEVIEADEVLSRYSPFLEKAGFSGDMVFVKDNRLDRIVEVAARGGDLYCLYDGRRDCVHAGFSWAIPEVYRILKLHGRKPPKAVERE